MQCCHFEDKRLTSRHGSVEFLTTMRYVERYMKPRDDVIEIGAGTGRYFQEDSDLVLFLQHHFTTCEREGMVGLTVFLSKIRIKNKIWELFSALFVLKCFCWMVCYAYIRRFET